MKKIIYEYLALPCIEVKSTISTDAALVALERELNERANDCWELIGFNAIECLYPNPGCILRMAHPVFKRVKQWKLQEAMKLKKEILYIL